VRHQDDPDRVVDVDRRVIDAEQCLEQVVDPAARADQRRERGGDDDCRQDERDRRQRAEQRLAPKVVSREDVCGGKGSRQREQC
jgi:hypothetical protein